MGIPILIVFYIWFTFANPDPKAFYGQIDSDDYVDEEGAPVRVGHLYSNKAEAEEADATDIHAVHRNFVMFFLWGILLCIVLYFVGFYKDWIVPLGEKNRTIDIVYTVLCIGMLVHWILGAHWRFRDPGRFACADLRPENGPYKDMTRREPRAVLAALENPLEQTSSCLFIKIYLDIFGLYIGGYIAWIILGLAGASRSPVWNPKNNMNSSEEKKKKKELKKAEKEEKR